MSHAANPGAAPTPLAPNHHAGQGSFSGALGYLLGLTMAVGRGADARLLCEVAGVVPCDRVLDIGCGPGTAAREAARRGARVVGLDPAAPMRRLARWLTPAGLAIDWVDGEAEGLPLPDAWASVLWSVASVHHWPDLDGGLREARRVLAPGGRLVIAEKRVEEGARGLASHGWTEAQARTFAVLCEEAGFEEVRVLERSAGRRRLVLVTARRP